MNSILYQKIITEEKNTNIELLAKAEVNQLLLAEKSDTLSKTEEKLEKAKAKLNEALKALDKANEIVTKKTYVLKCTIEYEDKNGVKTTLPLNVVSPNFTCKPSVTS